MLYFCFIFLFIAIIKYFLNDTTREMLDIENLDSVIEVDEDLPNFFAAVKFSEAREIIKEHEHMKEYYGFETVEFALIERL